MYHLVIISGGSDLPSRGPYQIAHHLRTHGYRVKVIQFIEHFSDEQMEKIVDRFVSSKTIIGISSTFIVDGHIYSRVFKFLEIAKSRHNNKIMLGGTDEVAASVIPHDFNLTGAYPEDRVVDVMNQQFGKIKKIPFIIDDLKFKFGEDDNFPKGSVMPVELSRHCVFNCKFCDFHNRGMKMNDRNYDYVLDELIDSHERFGSTKFNVLCSTFNDRESKLEEIFKRLDTLKFDVRLGGYIRIELLLKQKHLWSEYKKYFSHMIFGIETFSHEAGKAIGKGMHPDKIKQGLYEIREAMPDMFLSSGFIIGLPNDSMKYYLDVVNFIQTSNTLDSANFSPLFVHQKVRDGRYASEFDKNIEKYGYTTSEIKGNIKNVNWTRSDGFTFDKAQALAKQLSPKISKGISGIRSMFLWQYMERNEILNMAAQESFLEFHKRKVAEYANDYYNLL